ncbi:MAG: amidohydrolase family protein, partial [candidate division Zixibacteria bacterium]|nr:amidohydrolase family protein [candidate division Zixibacteria bacterium]
MCRLYCNGRIYTQAADGLIADSMAVKDNIIIAVGKRLQADSDFSSYKISDLKGSAILPGFVDAHTHFYFLAISMGNVKLDGLASFKDVLRRIELFSSSLDGDEWVVGEGYSPDQWQEYISPDRFMLDRVTGGRPAAIFSKDTHIMWVNSKALELAHIAASTPDPKGGIIARL